MNYTSIKNQQILGKLVEREIIHNASTLISELSNNDDGYSYQIMDLFYSVPNYEQSLENYIYDLSEHEHIELLNEYDVEHESELDAELVCYDKDLEYHYYEPLCFYIVSDWLGRKLKEKGQLVEEFMGFTIWARLTYGQAILLDYVIGSIGEDMEILEGMKYEWSV